MLLSQIFLFVINTLFGGVGTAAIGLAMYSIVRFNELSAILPANMLGMMLGAGIGICALASLGGCAARKRGTCLLSLYALLLFGIMCLEVVFGVVLGVYTGNLDVFKDSRYASSAAQEFGNVVSCAYTLCCMPIQKGGCHPLSLACNTSTIFDVTVPYAVCEGLNRFDASLLTAKCVTTDTFTTAVSSILSSVLWPLSMAAVGLAVVQLVCFVLSCCLMCRTYHHNKSTPPVAVVAVPATTNNV